MNPINNQKSPFKRLANWAHNLYAVRQVLLWSRRHTLPGLRRVSVYDVLSCFLEGAKNGTIWQRAKGLSYSLLMALPPLLIFMFTLIAYLPVDGLQDELLRQLNDIIPARFFDRISDTINDVMGHKHSKLLSIGFITSVILAANGIYGCLRSMNYANRTIRRRPFLPVYGISMLLVVLLYILVVVVAILLVGYKIIIGWLISKHLLPETTMTLILISSGRWLFLVFLTLMVLCVLYYFAQGKTLLQAFQKREEPGFGFFAPGSLFATALFFVITWGMQIYINNFNNFNLLYGSIGTLLMIMLWLFMNCWVLLIGYEINVSILAGLKEHKYPLIPRKKIFKKDKHAGKEKPKPVIQDF